VTDIRKTYRGNDRRELRAMLNRVSRFVAWNAKKTATPGRGGPVLVAGQTTLGTLNGALATALIAALAQTGPIFTPHN
jgi:hypothetical protein